MTDHAEALRAALKEYGEPRYTAWAEECALGALALAVEDHLPAVLAALDAVTAERDELLRRVGHDHTTKAGFSAQATEELR